MINAFMKKLGEKSYLRDLKRIDSSTLHNDILKVKDIRYVNDHLIEHTLDVYYKSDNRFKPVVIDIHGGGFISCYKEMDALFANCLAQRDFVVFCVNYRLAYPQFNVFDQIEDIANAMRWIVSNAEKYEGDTNEMYIAGHSAGGVLAIAESLLCTDEKMREAFHIDDRNYAYRGIILDCGLMHFYKNTLAYRGMRNMVFPKGYKRMDKYQYLIFEKHSKLKTLPKTVLFTNKKDTLRKMTYYFKRVLDAHHVDHRLFDAGTDGHMGIIFHTYSDENQRIMDDVQEYFEIGERAIDD